MDLCSGSPVAKIMSLCKPPKEPQTKQLQYTEPYTYGPLQPGDWIRVLRLLPGRFNDPIYCELVPTKLDKTAEYEPISYCWGDGDAKARQHIWCQGQSCFVTTSLFEALRRFRWEDRPRRLWADALCINQDSGIEKNHQVAMMARIYSCGMHTLIWLGESPEHVDVAAGISLIREFNEYMSSELNKATRASGDDIWDAICRIPSIPEEHWLASCVDRWKSVGKLLELPWFERVWVIQEVGLSKAATAFCGKDTIEFGGIVLFSAFLNHMGKYLPQSDFIRWGRIMRLLANIWSKFGRTDSWLDDGQTLGTLSKYYRETGPHGEDFLVILSQVRNFKATLEVDHIYALLGHPVAKTIMIEPVYNRSVEDTNQLLAKHICHSTRSLDLLCYVQHWDDENVEGTSNLPSWVPVWHEEHLYGLLTPHASFDASLSSKTMNRVLCDVEGTRLRVTALLLDVVATATPPFPYNRERVPEIVESCWAASYHARKIRQADQDWWLNFVWTLVRYYGHPDCLASDFAVFCYEHCSKGFPQLISGLPSPMSAVQSSPDANARRFIDQAYVSCGNKKFFVTERGICGIGLRPTRKGDVLAIVLGCRMPILLRPTDIPGHYRFVGQAYVNEIMRGEAIREWESGSLGIEFCEITLQ
jgi:hypothetical protein